MPYVLKNATTTLSCNLFFVQPQFSAIPEDGVKIESDDEDKINHDERNPQSIQDKRIIGDNEFSDSEDEGPPTSHRKDHRFIIMRNTTLIFRNKIYS